MNARATVEGIGGLVFVASIGIMAWNGLQTQSMPPLSAVSTGPEKGGTKSGAEPRAEWATMEKRNHAKIADLIAGEKALPIVNVEGRLDFWKDITALAPGNAAYADKRKELEAEVEALASFREHPEDGAEVVKIKPHKVGFGNVLTVDITIRNRSLSDLKDFRLTCTNHGPSGSVISESNRVLYDVISARSTRTFAGVNMGLINSQTSSTKCRVDAAAIY